jgi:hypothetical protein
MKLSDRIKRWWAPAKWRDEHPETSEGEGFALGHEEQLRQTVGKPGMLKGRGMLSNDRNVGRYGRR